MKDTEYVAIYRDRADGDWEFVACLSKEEIEMVARKPLDQFVETITTSLKHNGNEVKLVDCSEPDCPAVLDGKDVA